MKRNRRAKIVATLGPATSDHKTIRALFEAGVDVFRMNFSHGSHEDHAARHTAIRQIEADFKHPISILQDLQGPKIRIGTLKDGEQTLVPGEVLRVVLDKASSVAGVIPLPHPEVFAGIAPGHQILIDDGRRRLKVKSCTVDSFEAEVVFGGTISDRKGVNLPETVIELSPLTKKDRTDLAFGLELGVDWVALSFVQRSSDVMEARQIIGQRAAIMSKIEKPAALNAIDDIIAFSDAIMVARGDLGVEIPPEDVPGRQKQLVRLSRLAGKPVVIATQMLDSMVHSPAPTRAEASDVATGIYDGADAVMLSAETAAGDYPVETVAMMDRIIRRTEQDGAYRQILHALKPTVEHTVQHAIAAAASDMAGSIGAAAIVSFTSSGATALRLARNRPEVPILSITPNIVVARRLAQLWGTHSSASEEIASFREMVVEAGRHAKAHGFAKRGDRLVIVAGVPFGVPGSTNNIRVIEVS